MRVTNQNGGHPQPADVATGPVPNLLSRVSTIRGMVDASLIDRTTGRVLGRLTGADDVDPSTHAVDLVDAVLCATVYAPAVGTDRLEDIVITTAGSYHLIRPVRIGADPRVVLYVRLDRGDSNLALARRALAASGIDGD